MSEQFPKSAELKKTDRIRVQILREPEFIVGIYYFCYHSIFLWSRTVQVGATKRQLKGAPCPRGLNVQT